MRHTLAAQVLARALKNLYPDTKLAIGPTIDNGFYYDVECSKTISIDDLEKIEKEMHNIVKSKSSITKKLLSKSDALNVFKSLGESYKQEIINDSEQENDFQLYYQDNDEFVDLCRGPHLPNLSFIGAFKLTKVSGAYWKGDSNNKMLTRIYGTAWNTEKELNKYLHELEEAEKRDHRKIGKEMDLFHFQDEAPGMVFWHSDGWTIYRNLRNFVRSRLQESGYIEVNTPQVIDRKLWEASGHWDKYRENMFITEIDEEHANEKRVNALKPMNCPGHVQIYNQGIKSYKDLPLKYAEFGLCHRYERSGTMHGLMRVRAFTQDDGHIFCTENQIESETGLFIEFLSSLYSDLGFKEFDIKLSTRPEMRVGSDEIWDKAEAALESAIKNLGYPYRIDEGDGAFYGPKLDFVLTDAIGREWQCGTFQLDFNLAERLDAKYVAEDGNKHYPVMIHRAVLGSFERFIGILIENYAGKLPFWLAPKQVVVASIVSDANDYADEIANMLKKQGIRAESDLRNEKIGYKVREHSTKKVPFIFAIGNNEKANRSVSVRQIGSSDTSSMSLDDGIEFICGQNKV
jgi:threonyl-tRNA synthetase